MVSSDQKRRLELVICRSLFLLEALRKTFLILLVLLIHPEIVEEKGRLADSEEEVKRNVQAEDKLGSIDANESDEAANSDD